MMFWQLPLFHGKVSINSYLCEIKISRYTEPELETQLYVVLINHKSVTQSLSGLTSNH